MIPDLLIYVASAILGAIAVIFSGVSFAIPDAAEEAISYVFGYINVMNGILPVATLMTCVLLVLYTYLGKYAIKLFFKFIAPYIPFFNKHPIEPFADRVGASHTLDLAPRRKNTVDLRRKSKGRILYSTRDIK